MLGPKGLFSTACGGLCVVTICEPSWATPHAGQVDAFQDQRQVAQSHFDSGGRSRTIRPHSPRWFRHFKGAKFEPLDLGITMPPFARVYRILRAAIGTPPMQLD